MSDAFNSKARTQTLGHLTRAQAILSASLSAYPDDAFFLELQDTVKEFTTLVQAQWPLSSDNELPARLNWHVLQNVMDGYPELGQEISAACVIAIDSMLAE
jgi:hypothetical protein